ncbi:hypothetical protein E6C72_16890 [Azospirillum sp. TSH100]|nr:hypothetical protein E6C72_16890 [Azospirillum sp. TSH100]
MNESPLSPPGERVRVRGAHSKDSRDGHAAHPPHPAPLPGGEREILPSRNTQAFRKSRNASATARISCSVPMVTRRQLGRP